MRPLAHPFLGAALAAGLLAAAAHVAVTRQALRVGSQAIAAIVATVSLLLGLFVTYLDSVFRESEGPVVATSPDFRLVSYRSPGFFSSGSILLRLQSREGIASRESSQALACFIAESSGAGPEWLFDRASFEGKDMVSVSAKDGTTWQVRFTTKTLAPVDPLDRCTDAPDPSAD